MSPSATCAPRASVSRVPVPVSQTSAAPARVVATPKPHASAITRHDVRRKPQPGRRSVPAVSNRAATAPTSGKRAWVYMAAWPSADASSIRVTSTSSARAMLVLATSRAAVVARKMLISRTARERSTPVAVRGAGLTSVDMVEPLGTGWTRTTVAVPACAPLGNRLGGARGLPSGGVSHRIFTTSVASVYPHYVAKVEKKGRTQAELDEVIAWLTGFDEAALRDASRGRHDVRGLLRRRHPQPACLADHRLGVRREGPGGRGPAHAADPLPRQARRRARQGPPDGEGAAGVERDRNDSESCARDHPVRWSQATTRITLSRAGRTGRGTRCRPARSGGRAARARAGSSSSRRCRTGCR